ncbi:MAG: hypothetical protein EB120_01075 [Proteobacteria bacterium]|nr:hypothetical protein [Pseudomonadota bacterium]
MSLSQQKLFLSVALLFLMSFFALRTQTGVDFADESYHLALAKKFSQGAIPFRDEHNLTQSFALMTSPFLKLIIGWVHSPDGIVLKMRWLFLLFHALCSIWIWRTLRALFSPAIALTATLAYFSFIPLNMYSLFYVNLGMGLLGLALTFFSPFDATSRTTNQNVAASLLLALSCVAHPVLLIPAAYLFFYELFKQSFRITRHVLISFFIFCSILCAFKWGYGFSFQDVFETLCLSKARTDELGVSINGASLLRTLGALAIQGPYFLGIIAVVLGILKFRLTSQRNCLWVITLLLLLLPMIFLNARTSQGGQGNASYLIVLAWLGPLLFLKFFPTTATRTFFFGYWIPCFLATFFLVLISTGGMSSSATGLLPLFPFSIGALSTGIERALYLRKTKAFTFLSVVPALFFILVLVRSTGQSAMREKDISELHFPVQSGVYQGLQTTEFKKFFIEELEQQLRSLSKGKGRIVFSCFFPAGYLISPLSAGVDFLWAAPPLTQIAPEVTTVVRIYDSTYSKLGLWPQTCPALTEKLNGRTGTLIKTAHYEIWTANDIP